jgi:nicotinamide phosphoribosyltransferase
MCSYDSEIETYRHLLTEVYPSGNVSIVSDSYDFWNVVDNVLPQLKNIIMNRKGKTIIRPDSGDPVDIICGELNLNIPANQRESTIKKGLVERLYEIFGGTVNEKGYKELDTHIGVIYGDSITTDRASRICQGLIQKGFASTNVNLGVGSFSYQYCTRDTFGFALKGTAIINNGVFKQIFKAPKTDKDNFKKSNKGCVAVLWEDNEYRVVESLNPEQIKVLDENGENQLEDFFVDGKYLYENKFSDIRQRIKEESNRIYQYNKV